MPKVTAKEGSKVLAEEVDVTALAEDILLSVQASAEECGASVILE
jgi:hypothetical protein